MFKLLIPEPYAILARVAALLLVVCAVIGYVHVKDRQHERNQLDAAAARVEQQAAKQVLHTVEVKQEQQNITEGVSYAYQTSLGNLNSYYARRLREQTRHGAGPVPVVPGPTASPDAAAANAVPPAAGSQPDRVTLEHDCAVTTLELIGLQDWARQQRGVLP